MWIGKIRRMLAGAAAALLCTLALAPCASAAPARRTVRVGLSDTDIVTLSEGVNRTVAFQKDYMQAVAQYAGWDCIFVPASWQNCLEMVRDGRIDVLMDVTKSPEREQIYDFSSESMGTEMCYMFGRADTSLRYDDVAGFNGITVGYEDGSSIVEIFREYGRNKGFTFKTKAYHSGGDMFRGLDAGEVDAVVQTNFYDTPSGHVILDKCSPSPVYIVTSKANPALQTELDSAMAQLFSYNPDFNAQLYQYHFGAGTSQAIGYTQDEREYMASHPVVSVMYETDWRPFEYDKDGKAEGITPDLIRAIGKETGIDFRFVLSSSTQSIYNDIGKLSNDYVMAASYDYAWADSHDLQVTQPYITGAVMRVLRSGVTQPVVAATVEGGYLEHQVIIKHPELKTVSYPNAEDCMKALARGEADCTFLNYYQANYYRSLGDYDSFVYQPDENITQGISLAVTSGSNPALFSILSKAMQHISANTVQGILSENAVQTEFSLRQMLRRNPVQAALWVGALGILGGLLVFSLISSGARKRQNVRLAAAMREAETANNAKSEFLSRMSHDMRTPLNGIIGMTYLTEKMELPQAALENLNKIDTSSRFLLNLINDLLDMTKAESGKIELHPEPYPAREFTQYIDAVIRPLCDGKNQQLSAEIAVPECCVPVLDKLRINQIVFNMLSNAVKYTPEGGKIAYSVRGGQASGGRMDLHIQVSDNGIGMSEQFQKILFTPFSQEDRNDNSEFRGSGLGLAITKQLVDLMKGTIAVKSKIGQGTTLTVELQADCADARRDAGGSGAAPAPAHDQLLEGRHILLCEDHPLNQEIARQLLAEKGMVVEIADDGQRGVRAFSHSSVGYYDAILMDIRMPVMDGYAATRAIRALERPDAAKVPILAMSADVLTDDLQKCREAGMNGHVAKPIDPQTMYQEIARAITEAKNK